MAQRPRQRIKFRIRYSRKMKYGEYLYGPRAEAQYLWLLGYRSLSFEEREKDLLSMQLYKADDSRGTIAIQFKDFDEDGLPGYFNIQTGVSKDIFKQIVERFRPDDQIIPPTNAGAWFYPKSALLTVEQPTEDVEDPAIAEFLAKHFGG